MRFIFLALLAGCPQPEIQWWEDPCGRRDPIQLPCDMGIDAVEVGDDPTCADEGITADATCEEDGATCVQLRPLACANDLERIVATEAVLTCGEIPPDDLCPQSSRAVKRDITYVDGADRKALARQALDIRLARYAYRDAPEQPRLGYILEDAPDAAFSGEGRVDLYAFSAAILAAVQEQEQELAALRAEVEQLRQAECPR